MQEGNGAGNDLKGDYARSLKIKNIYLEMTNICNFDCNFCPIRISRRQPGKMEMGLFKKIVDEIAATDLTQRIGFHVLGEPLIHPELVPAIAYCAERGLETSLTTNGALLTEAKVLALGNAGLTYLGISLETMDAGEHESRSGALPFARYYRQIIEAIATFRKNSDTKITLNLMNTVSKKYFSVDCDIGIDKIKDDFKSKLVDLIYDIKSAIGQPVLKEEIIRDLKKIKLNSSSKVNINNKIDLYVQLFWDWGNAFTSRKIYPARIGYCGYAFKHIGILYDGTVNICCGDYDGGTSIGNVQDHSLVELLGSEAARRVKAGFDRHRVLDPYCRRCLGAPSRAMAVIKGIASIMLFKFKGHPLEGAKQTRLSPSKQ